MTTVRAACGMLLHQMSGAFGEEGGGADGGCRRGCRRAVLEGARGRGVAAVSKRRRRRKTRGIRIGGRFARPRCSPWGPWTISSWTPSRRSPSGVCTRRSPHPGSSNSCSTPTSGRGPNRSGWVDSRKPTAVFAGQGAVGGGEARTRRAPGGCDRGARRVAAIARPARPRAPRVGACRALAQYAPLAPKDGLKPFLGPAYQRLGTLLESEFNAGEARKTNAGAAAARAGWALHRSTTVTGARLSTWCSRLFSSSSSATTRLRRLGRGAAPATLRVWAAKVADPLLAADARDVLEALAAVPACLPPLHQLAVPTLSGVLAAPDRQGPMLVESTLDLLGGLLKPAAKAEAGAAHAACFRHVVALAVTSDDAGVLQSAAECLRAFLRFGRRRVARLGGRRDRRRRRSSQVLPRRRREGFSPRPSRTARARSRRRCWGRCCAGCPARLRRFCPRSSPPSSPEFPARGNPT